MQKFELPNGLRLLVKEDHRLPFVEFRAVFQGGVLAETLDNNGVTQLTGKLLLKGHRAAFRRGHRPGNRVRRRQHRQLRRQQQLRRQRRGLSSDFATGLDLLADVLLNPTFPAPALEREREVQLASIRAQKDHLLQSAALAMRRALFGERGYGLDALGTEASVQKHPGRGSEGLPLTACRAQQLRPGHLRRRQARRRPSRRGEGLRRLAARRHRRLWTLRLGTLDSIKRVTETRDKKQAVLVIGFRGTTLHDADRYPLELVQEACSDLGSRLFLRIREKLGLAYYVGAQNVVGLAPGYFAFYAGTAPEKAALVETELLSEAELLRSEGLTAEELKRAKAKIIGQRKIARQDLGSFAMTTALDELYGLGYAHTDTEDALYEAVTLDQVKAVAQQYLKPDAMVISLVRPQA